jgi:thiopeptide-type bacteriocin biosynthesis protein
MTIHYQNPFVLFRTPALAWEVVTRWGEDLTAARALLTGEALDEAVERDRGLLRARLRGIVARPEVRAAIEFASPSLASRMGDWLGGVQTEAALSTEDAVVRYVMRMAGRATPFGLFAGMTMGEIGPRTALAVPGPGAHTRRTRLNTDYLFALADQLSNDPQVRPYLRYRPNETIYEVGEFLRYHALRVKEQLRSYPLCEMPAGRHVSVALERARGSAGATLEEIAEALCDEFPGVAKEDARVFATGLARNHLLRSPLHPAVTGGEPVEEMIAQLRAIPPAAHVAEALEAVVALLSESDRGTVTRLAGARAEATSKLRDVAPSLESAAPLMRVDLWKRAARGEAMLRDTVARAIGAALMEIAAVAVPDPNTLLADFARAFEERYQRREVALLEALDGEAGIGFPVVAVAGNDREPPLLAGLAFGKEGTRSTPWGRREDHLLLRLASALAKGADEIALDDDDVAALSNPKRRPLPPTFNIVATLAARSAAAVDRGEYRVWVHGAGGTTAGALLGRFTRDDAALEAATRALFRLEASQDPEAIHAEIAHLPEQLTSNLLLRPALRDYEIDVAWGAGGPAERRIPLSDLLVSVNGDEIQLRSRKHGRRVVPHMATAHAIGSAPSAAYRFLALLQTQGIGSELGWTWGEAFASAPFLPRVVRGRLVLSLARWRIPGEALAELGRLKGGARFAAVTALRGEHRLPRYVTLVDGDNLLPVDLENVLSIDSLLGAAKGRVAQLEEMFPPPGELIAEGDDGAYTHEMILPLARTPDPAAATPPLRPQLRVVTPLAPIPDRAHKPGGEWLYAKLYCGVGGADRVLVGTVKPLLGALKEAGKIDRWFFVRYADPDWHIRLRIRGESAALWSSVAERLFDAARKAGPLVRRVALDTYDPETERYGGEHAIELAERIFEADSEATLAVIEAFRSDAEARWRMAFVGMDRLLSDLGLPNKDKREVAARARRAQEHRFIGGAELGRQLGRKYRPLRAELDELIVTPAARYAPALAAFARRSARVAPLAGALRDLDRRGKLARSYVDIAVTLLHMSAIRAVRGSVNAQEVVLYEFLERTYATAVARERQRATPSLAGGAE